MMADGSEVEHFLAQVSGQPVSTGPLFLENKNDKRGCARVIQEYWKSEQRFVCHWKGAFYVWNGHKWEIQELVEKSRDEMFVDLYALLETAETQVLDKKTGEMKIVPLHPNGKMVAELQEALMSLVVHKGEANTWLVKPEGVADNLMPVLNGLLDPETCILHPPSPDFFNTAVVSINWKPEWADWSDEQIDQFVANSKFGRTLVDEWFEDEPDQVTLLQEQVGYTLTPDTRQDKILCWIGKTRSGKGTLLRCLSALKKGSTVSPSSNALSKPMERDALIDKDLAILADVRMGKSAESADLTELLLKISGRDEISIPRKYRSAHKTSMLPLKFLLASNGIPYFFDPEGALAGRFVFVDFKNSFYGREDTSLTEKLLEELEVIFLWGLVGLRRLNTQGKFSTSRNHEALSMKANAKQVPVKTFVDKYLVEDTEGFIPTLHLHAVFSEFCKVYKISQFDRSAFVRGFLKATSSAEAHYPSLQVTNYKLDGGGELLESGSEKKQVRGYKGFKWRSDMTDMDIAILRSKHFNEFGDFNGSDVL